MSTPSPSDPDYKIILTVVPREVRVGGVSMRHANGRPMVAVDFKAHQSIPLANGTVHPNILVIKPRSNRAYHVVTPEDAQWMTQVIDEVLRLRASMRPAPRHQSRSSPPVPVTDASVAASSTSPAAASARRPRRTRQS